MATASDTSEHEDDEKPAAADDEGAGGDKGAGGDDGDTEAPAKPVIAAKKAVSKPGAKRARRAPPPPPKKGSIGTSLVLFVVVLVALGGGFAYFGQETGGTGPSAPKWKTGDLIDVEITLVASDKGDLACAAATEVGGRHCQFEAQSKAWSKTPNDADENLLKPYTTTDGVQLTAAGLWSQPALATGLPATRFSVKCKYKVEGKLAKPSVRWNTDGPWYAQTTDWYAGSVAACAVTP